MKKWFVKPQWLHTDKIIYFEIIGDLDENTWTDFQKIWVEDYLDTATTPIHTIIDISGLGDASQNWNNIHTGHYIDHSNIESVTLVGFEHNPVAMSFSSILRSDLGNRFKQVESLVTAKNVLRYVDKSLPVIV